MIRIQLPARLLSCAGFVLGSFLLAAPASADPVLLRVGVGNAAEEQLWLMEAKPEVTPNQGKAYTLDVTRFGGTDKRFQAFEAGALDLATASANSAIVAASEGFEFKMVASLSRESERGFVTQYMVLADSPIHSVKDLEGKTIALNGLNSSAHLWAKLVLEKNGLDPERDVTFVPVRFPAQGEALRSGKADIATFPQPFAQVEEMKGGVRTLFTSKDAMPFEEELMLVIAREDALAEKEAAIRAFLADLAAATRYYNEHPEEARQALIDNKQVRIDADVYLPMKDYYRDPSIRVDAEALGKMQEVMLESGFQRNPVDFGTIVDLSYLPED